MWIKGILLFLLAFGAIAKIADIGEKREPITKGNAIAQVLLNTALIVLILTAWD